MNHEHQHDTTGYAAAAPFTEAEIKTFHADDKKEARIVVLLISSIFLIGVVIYSIVATAVDRNPQESAVVSPRSK